MRKSQVWTIISSVIITPSIHRAFKRDLIGIKDATSIGEAESNPAGFSWAITDDGLHDVMTSSFTLDIVG